MEFYCENEEFEYIVIISILFVFGDRKNKLKGFISVVNKDSGLVRYEVYKKKKKQIVCICVNDYSLKIRVKYFIKGKKKCFIFKIKKLKKCRNFFIMKGYKVVFRMVSKMFVKSKIIIFESFNGK